jgi:hypothetical protein
MSEEFKYVSNVSDAEFKAARVAMIKAIAKKDTPEEWAHFAGQVLVFVGKMAIKQVGFGPVLDLAGELFKDNEEILAILKMLGEQNETT